MPLPGMDAPSFLSGTNDLPVTGPAPPSTPPPSTAAVFFADPAADPSRRPGSIHVRLGDAAVADGVTDGALEAELSRALAAFGTDIERFELYNKGSYVARPFAMVNFAAPLAQSEAARALLAGGAVEIFGQACGIKQRRAAKTQRKRHTEAADALARSEEARVAAARPAWQPHMLGLYPQRATTLDQVGLTNTVSLCSHPWSSSRLWPFRLGWQGAATMCCAAACEWPPPPANTCCVWRPAAGRRQQQQQRHFLRCRAGRLDAVCVVCARGRDLPRAEQRMPRHCCASQNALVGQLGPPLLENLELYLRQQVGKATGCLCPPPPTHPAPRST
jgi:hypothetical protein